MGRLRPVSINEVRGRCSWPCPHFNLARRWPQRKWGLAVRGPCGGRSRSARRRRRLVSCRFYPASRLPPHAARFREQSVRVPLCRPKVVQLHPSGRRGDGLRLQTEVLHRKASCIESQGFRCYPECGFPPGPPVLPPVPSSPPRLRSLALTIMLPKVVDTEDTRWNRVRRLPRHLFPIDIRLPDVRLIAEEQQRRQQNSARRCLIIGSHASRRMATASRKPAAQSDATTSPRGPSRKIESKSSGSD